MDNAVITGIGMISRFADSIDTLYKVMRIGEPSGGKAPMPNLKKRGLMPLDNISKKAYAALQSAIEDSGLIETESDRVGIFLGNDTGSVSSIVDFDDTVRDKGFKAVMPVGFINTVMNAPAGHLAILNNFKGMNVTFSNGTSSSQAAMEYCVQMLNDGRISVGAVGGIEEITPVYERRFESESPILSSGACMMIAETEKNAAGRGVGIYAKWLGSASGYNINANADDMYEIIQNALDNAEISEVDFVISSGSRYEEEAAERLKAPVFDIKSIIGETGGASGAFAAAAACAVIKYGKMPNGTELGNNPKGMITSFGIDGYISCFILGGENQSVDIVKGEQENERGNKRYDCGYA